MNIRRAAIALCMSAIAVLPSLGHAVNDPNRPVTGTACTVGDEQLKYSTTKGALGWIAQGTVKCPDPGYDNLFGVVQLVQVTGAGADTAHGQYGLSGSTVIQAPGSCSVSPCAILDISNAAKPRPVLTTPGLYMVKTTGGVVDTGQAYQAVHASCFLVTTDTKGTPTVTPVLQDCQP